MALVDNFPIGHPWIKGWELNRLKRCLKPPASSYQRRIIKWLAMVVVLVVALMVAGSSIQFLCWEGDVLTQELRSLVGARSVGWRPPLSAVYPLPTHPHHTICHHTVTLHFGLGKIKNQTSLAIIWCYMNHIILKSLSQSGGTLAVTPMCSFSLLA